MTAKNFLTFILVATGGAALAEPSGILMDDEAGEYTGHWVESTRQPNYVGPAYRHDNRENPGELSVRFTPDIPESGEYEVRLIHVATDNRATRAKVTIVHADGTESLTVNQREAPLENGVPKSLGTFRFEAGGSGHLELSNADADGYVVVDAVQFVPPAAARAERENGRSPGVVEHSAPAADPVIEEMRRQMAARAALSPLAKRTDPDARPSRADDEPVLLAEAADPSEIDGKHYDLVVVGATGGGIACAVRAAREGLTVLLTQHNGHIGGMMTNGLMQWDALHGGPRAPIFTELLGNIEKHYIETAGENSEDHQTIRYTHEHYPIGWAEPHVAEREYNRLVAGEKNLTLLLSHIPVAAERDGALLTGLALRAHGAGDGGIRVTADAFADGTYEGDLFALANVPWRAGREARDEYDEPHAGKVFCNIDGHRPESIVADGVNIRPYSSRQGEIDPESPFTADDAVQAYNYRFCVSRDPENRIMLFEPPPDYNREEYVNYNRKGIATNAGPRKKSHMNSPILPGENHRYPDAAWPEREEIIRRHKNFALGLIWFLQNDESVSESKRAAFREWGLPRDEFADNGHIPYEMYVREARRIVGRHVFTERDNSLAKGFGRTPVFSDSIAVTDWYMDSHACTTDSKGVYHYDGKLILTEESRPAQIPYRSLLPQNADNLLVPVCLSATHIAWGAVRLEPVWMQTGEAAGYAAALARERGVAPAKLNPERLVRALVRKRQMISFFNDVRVTDRKPWIPAVQYFGARGFFPNYDARAEEPLTRALAEAWAKGFAAMRSGKHDPNAFARELAALEIAPDAPKIRAGEFALLLPQGAPIILTAKLEIEPSSTISRGSACRLMFGMPLGNQTLLTPKPNPVRSGQ
ncbi:MAG: FAD-dependent oxidoreductase [Verrucomicrobiae bacterium]|nr:FAD-dependent oxidoreductase [Verrucomicrobiae bacterium]MCP5541856.1 FAD-dependent oxidoreductase [Akkermansiaceae bacterium]